MATTATRYAKLVNGVWSINPRPLPYTGNKDCINPKPRHYLAMGYLPIVEAEMPEDMWNDMGEPMYIVAYEYGAGADGLYDRVIMSYVPISE